MAKSYIQPGNVITVTAPANVTSGAGVLVGDIFGIAMHSASSGAQVEIALEGVFEVAKTSDQEWSSVGAAIYWDAGNSVVTSTASTNKLIGVNVATAANPSATGVVRLNGVFSVKSGAQDLIE